MLPTAVYVLGLLGGTVLSGLGALSQKMTDKEVTAKSVGRDFIAGLLIVLFLGFLIPDSFAGLSSMIPSLPALPTSLAGGNYDLELQVDPRM
jgi:hypothetical protein